jgi:hypothetical protein
MLGNKLVTVVAGVSVLLAAPAVRAEQATTQGQRARVVAHSTALSSGGGTLGIEMTNGDVWLLTLADGEMLLNGHPVGNYRELGPMAEGWREFVRRAAELSTQDALAAFAEFGPGGLNGAEQAGLRAYQRTVENLLAGRAGPAAVPEMPALPPEVAARIAETVAQAEQMSEQIAEEVARARAQVEVEPGARVQVGRAPRTDAVGLGSVIGGLTNLAAVFLAMMFIGFGITFFAPRQLETVSDTVFRSFWRSFLAGLFALPLIVPVLGMIIVGLTLTVVGVLVVPFAAVAYIVAVVLALAMGYIAVARSVGEIYVRRKTAQSPQPGSWLPLKFVAYGLAALLAIWLPAVFLSWVPVVGNVLGVVAAVLTWFIATAGFGATIISRGGVRGTIIRRIDAALTDEHYWDDVASLSIPGPSSRESS